MEAHDHRSRFADNRATGSGNATFFILFTNRNESKTFVDAIKCCTEARFKPPTVSEEEWPKERKCRLIQFSTDVYKDNVTAELKMRLDLPHIKDDDRRFTAWIGQIMIGSSDESVNLSGSHQVCNSTWSSNEPDDTQSACRGVLMNEQGKLSDAPCAEKHTFICECSVKFVEHQYSKESHQKFRNCSYELPTSKSFLKLGKKFWTEENITYFIASAIFIPFYVVLIWKLLRTFCLCKQQTCCCCTLN